MEFIDTKFGKLRLDQLPVVKPEAVEQTFLKSMLFFSIIIIILLIIFSIQWNTPHNVKVTVKDRMNLKTVKTNVKATSIYLQNIVSKNPTLENIVVITTSGNMMNFRPTALPGAFRVNFGETLDIKDIVLITGKLEENFITNLDITLYNVTSNGEETVFEYSGPLLDKSENTIHISKVYYSPLENEILDESPDLTSVKHKFDEKIIANENELAIQLSETDEKYVSF
jgi:hypothetical protein